MKRKVSNLEPYGPFALKMTAVLKPSPFSKLMYPVPRSQSASEVVEKNTFTPFVVMTRSLEEVLEKASALRQVKPVEMQVMCVQSYQKIATDYPAKG